MRIQYIPQSQLTMANRGLNTFFSLKKPARLTMCHHFTIERAFTFLSNLSFVNNLFIRGYAESKKCLRDLIDSDCNYPAETKKMLDFTSYGVYNPFCADNRDPGATKNDQCYGVLDDDNAAAGTKPNVFQTLIVAIFLFLFLFKA